MARNAALFVILTALCTFAGHASLDAQEARPEATFSDVIHVRVVELNVAVVDSKGEPVPDLEKKDFSVAVDGEPMEVVGITPPLPGADSAGGRTDRLVILFDLPSLEPRPRKKLVKAVKPLVQRYAERGGRVLIATTSPSFEIIEGYSSEPAALMNALDSVAESEIDASQLMASKRTLRRSIRTAETYRGGFSKPSSSQTSATMSSGNTNTRVGSSSNDDSQELKGMASTFGTLQGTQYMNNVIAIRDHETMRLLQSLGGLEGAVRCTAGPGRRKDVLWFGQDLLTRPAMDLYQPMYAKFEPWADEINMARPEIWAEEKSLAPQFDQISRIAQIMGASIHVIDTSDDERSDALDAVVINSPTTADSGSNDSSKPLGTVGVEQAAASIDGGAFLAAATGGTFDTGLRGIDDFVEDLENHLRSSYTVAYTPTRELDGGLDNVQVRVARPGATVQSTTRTARLSADHLLADRALTELLIGLNEDPVGFKISMGARQDMDDARHVQTFKLEFPTSILAEEENGTKVGCRLRIAVVVTDASGNAGAPRLFPMEVHLDAQRASQASRAAVAFRLMMDSEPLMIGVAVRDEATGAVGSHAVDPGRSPG